MAAASPSVVPGTLRASVTRDRFGADSSVGAALRFWAVLTDFFAVDLDARGIGERGNGKGAVAEPPLLYYLFYLPWTCGSLVDGGRLSHALL
jgi:hypothetical protein